MAGGQEDKGTRGHGHPKGKNFWHFCKINLHRQPKHMHLDARHSVFCNIAMHSATQMFNKDNKNYDMGSIFGSCPVVTEKKCFCYAVK